MGIYTAECICPQYPISTHDSMFMRCHKLRTLAIYSEDGEIIEQIHIRPENCIIQQNVDVTVRGRRGYFLARDWLA